MRLYAFSFDGIMLYAFGNLSPKQVEIVSIFSKNFIAEKTGISKEKLFSLLIKELNQQINTNLKVTDINHVFNCDII